MAVQRSTENALLETALDRLQFDPKTGRLVSFRAKLTPDQEFIQADDKDPAFVVQYLDEDRLFRQISSQQAEEIETRCEHDPAGQTQALVTEFRRRSKSVAGAAAMADQVT